MLRRGLLPWMALAARGVGVCAPLEDSAAGPSGKTPGPSTGAGSGHPVAITRGDRRQPRLSRQDLITSSEWRGLVPPGREEPPRRNGVRPADQDRADDPGVDSAPRANPHADRAVTPRRRFASRARRRDRFDRGPLATRCSPRERSHPGWPWLASPALDTRGGSEHRARLRKRGTRTSPRVSPSLRQPCGELRGDSGA